MLNKWPMHRELVCGDCSRIVRVSEWAGARTPRCMCGGAFELVPLSPMELESELRTTQTQLIATQRALVALLDKLHDHELVESSAVRSVLRLLDTERIS
jgi:hypothetical protein